MKAFYKLSFLLWATLFLVSCEKDDDTQIQLPIISDLEIGQDNNKIGYVGEDLHIEATIFAAEKIKTVEISIHHEDNQNGWNFNQIYSEFENLKNTEFHEHIDIPLNALRGKYHLHFKVTDQKGNATEEEAFLEIREAP